FLLIFVFVFDFAFDDFAFNGIARARSTLSVSGRSIVAREVAAAGFARRRAFGRSVTGSTSGVHAGTGSLEGLRPPFERALHLVGIIALQRFFGFDQSFVNRSLFARTDFVGLIG